MAHSPKSKRRAPKTKAPRVRVPDAQAEARVFTMSPAGFDAFIALVRNPPKLSREAQARFARKRVWE
jgi:hypothetical protein